jgi:hypothetical protein
MMPEGMRGKVALWSLFGLLAWARPALADSPPVNVTLEGCANLDPAEVERIFSAELGSANPGVSDPTVTEVTITCEAARVVIRVKDPLSRKTVQRSFDTSTFDPKATPRLIALAATELVLASWAELYSNPQPTVEPEGPKPTPDEATAVRRTLRELAFFREEPEPPTPARDSEEAEVRVMRVLGLFSLRGFPRDDSMLVGGGLRLGEERFRLVGWSLDTLIERGNLVAHAGETITKSRATSWTVGGALLAYYSYKQFVTVRLGVGLRAGAVFADKPRVAPWGWPLGVSVITFRSQSFVLDFSGEGGYVAFPASGGEVSGFWLSGQIGMGMVL